MAQVFISYPHEAAKNVMELVNGIRAKGVDVWCAEEKVPPDDDVKAKKAKVMAALEDAKIVIFIVMPGSSPSPQIQEEQMAALESYWGGGKKMFLPILIGRAQTPVFLKPWRSLKVQRKSELGKTANQAVKLLRAKAGPREHVIRKLEIEHNERLENLEKLVRRMRAQRNERLKNLERSVQPLRAG
jgi:TIR domain